MSSYSKYTLQNGKTRVRVHYRDEQGKSQTKSGFTTLHSAKLWAAQNTVQMEAGIRVAPSRQKVTIAELYAQHYAQKKASWKPLTQKVVQSSWDTHVEPKWGDTPIGKIEHSDIQEWVLDLQKSNSPSTVHKAFQCLTACFRVAQRQGIIVKMNTDGVVLPSKSKKHIEVLSAAQLDMFMGYLDTEKAALVGLLASAGLRWGEATALRVQDVDLEARTATITRTVIDPGKGSGLTIADSTKGGRGRVVAFSEEVTGLLREHIGNKAKRSLIWCSVGDTPLIRPTRRSWWHSALDKAQMVDPTFPSITPHDLRHTAASRMITAGAPIIAVQHQLGHASAKMTLDVYSHLQSDNTSLLREYV